VVLLAAALVLSMIGCSRRYVVVDADKPANITQGEMDRLYQDNEMCLKELEELRGR
jgi:hypothetical protein